MSLGGRRPSEACMKSWIAVALNLKEIETLLWESDLNSLKRGLLRDGGRNYFESATEKRNANLMEAHLSIL